ERDQRRRRHLPGEGSALRRRLARGHRRGRRHHRRRRQRRQQRAGHGPGARGGARRPGRRDVPRLGPGRAHRADRAGRRVLAGRRGQPAGGTGAAVERRPERTTDHRMAGGRDPAADVRRVRQPRHCRLGTRPVAVARRPRPGTPGPRRPAAQLWQLGVPGAHRPAGPGVLRRRQSLPGRALGRAACGRLGARRDPRAVPPAAAGGRRRRPRRAAQRRRGAAAGHPRGHARRPGALRRGQHRHRDRHHPPRAGIRGPGNHPVRRRRPVRPAPGTAGQRDDPAHRRPGPVAAGLRHHERHRGARVAGDHDGPGRRRGRDGAGGGVDAPVGAAAAALPLLCRRTRPLSRPGCPRVTAGHEPAAHPGGPRPGRRRRAHPRRPGLRRRRGPRRAAGAVRRRGAQRAVVPGHQRRDRPAHRLPGHRRGRCTRSRAGRCHRARALPRPRRRSRGRGTTAPHAPSRRRRARTTRPRVPGVPGPL
ncbi:MAG: Xylulose kinase, partial [uncultured Blastococcus sp.]